MEPGFTPLFVSVSELHFCILGHQPGKLAQVYPVGYDDKTLRLGWLMIHAVKRDHKDDAKSHWPYTSLSSEAWPSYNRTLFQLNELVCLK